MYTILIWSLGLLTLGALIYIATRYLLPLLLPFIFAWLVVGLTRGGAEKLADRMRIPRKITRLVTSLTLVLVSSLALGVILWRSIASLLSFLSDIGESNGLFSLLEKLISSEKPIFGDLMPQEVATFLGESLNSLISSAMTAVGGAATRLLSGLPTAFLFLLVTMISIVYFALDYDNISRFVMNLLPQKLKVRLGNIRGSVVSVAGKYIRSYLLILLITYFVLFLGLGLLRVDHSPIIALLVAFLDILPVIGVGTVLLPWSLISFALGDKFLGIGLLVLFVANAVLRQLIEPKIVGKSLNLHPLISLGTIYLGYALFGFAGLLNLPLLAVVVSAFLKNNSAAKVDEPAI